MMPSAFQTRVITWPILRLICTVLCIAVLTSFASVMTLLWDSSAFYADGKGVTYYCPSLAGATLTVMACMLGQGSPPAIYVAMCLAAFGLDLAMGALLV